jgi:hypothetical protein
LICFQEPIAIRSGPWKLINRLGSAGFLSHRPDLGSAFRNRDQDELNPDVGGADEPAGQLYQLDTDPGESKNLWNERPDVVRQLLTRLRQLSK